MLLVTQEVQFMPASVLNFTSFMFDQENNLSRSSHSNTVSYDWVEGGVGMSYKSDGLIHWKF